MSMCTFVRVGVILMFVHLLGSPLGLLLSAIVSCFVGEVRCSPLDVLFCVLIVLLYIVGLRLSGDLSRMLLGIKSKEANVPRETLARALLPWLILLGCWCVLQHGADVAGSTTKFALEAGRGLEPVAGTLIGLLLLTAPRRVAHWVS